MAGAAGRLALVLLALLCAAFAGVAEAHTAEEWRDRVVYQVRVSIRMHSLEVASRAAASWGVPGGGKKNRRARRKRAAQKTRRRRRLSILVNNSDTTHAPQSTRATHAPNNNNNT